jgi:hypothetical protein
MGAKNSSPMEIYKIHKTFPAAAAAPAFTIINNNFSSTAVAGASHSPM